VTVAGTNAFAAPRELVRSVATWLLHDFDPAATYAEQPGAITGDPEIHGSVQLTHAWCIGRLLLKQSKRKRSISHHGLITVTLAKRDRKWLTNNLPKRAAAGTEALRGQAVRFRDLLMTLPHRRRGRPRLDLLGITERLNRSDDFSDAYFFKLRVAQRRAEDAEKQRRLRLEYIRAGGTAHHPAISGESEFERWLDTRGKNLPNKV